jgi:diacylglycerol kinase (ATP)
MKARWIFNANAGKSEAADDLQDAIRAIGGQDIYLSEHPDHTAEAVACCHGEGFDTVIACGGDGTVNSVVSGLMACKKHRPTLGVLPMGTGNDFARTLAMPLDGLEAIEVLQTAEQRPCDVAKVLCGGESRISVNVSAGGFSGQVSEAATDEVKSAWGSLAYLRSAVTAIRELTRFHTRVRFDGGPVEEMELINVIVANARTAAGGTVVAPQASIEDGLFDVVLVRGGTLLDLTGVAARLIAGDYTAHDLVELRRCKTLAVESEPAMTFNVDGDLLEPGPLEFELIAGAINVLVGPEYVPTVEAKPVE